MDSYHDRHYGLFHILLPRLLREGLITELTEATRNNAGGSVLHGIWNGIAGSHEGDPQVRAGEFAVELREANGRTLLLITTPQVRGALEAAYVAVVFDKNDPTGSLRYFTCEAPSMPGGPWFIGEIRGNFQRSNMGVITDVSVEGMAERVIGIVGNFDVATTVRGPGPRVAGVREIPDVDALLGGKKTDSPAAGPLGGGGRDRLGGGAPTGAPSPGTTASGDRESIPSMSGPVKFGVKWDSPAGDVATETLVNLYRVRTAGGSVLVMNAKKTKGLAKATSSYVQFMWNNDDSLVVEIQGDYTYWGVAVPSQWWPVFEAAGMTVPTSGNGNFHMLVPTAATHEERQSLVSGVFKVFADVLRPSGKIDSKSF